MGAAWIPVEEYAAWGRELHGYWPEAEKTLEFHARRVGLALLMSAHTRPGFTPLYGFFDEQGELLGACRGSADAYQFLDEQRAYLCARDEVIAIDAVCPVARGRGSRCRI